MSQAYSPSPSLAVSNAVLYIDSGDTLTALHTTDGSVVWSSSAPGSFDGDSPSPTIIGDTVYLLKAGKVLAFNTVDGSQKWQDTWPTSSSADGVVSGSDDLVVAGDNNTASVRTLSAFHAADGSVVWSNTYTVGRLTSVEPSVYSGVVYVRPAGSLVALDVKTGAQLWSTSLAGDMPDRPVLSNGMLFFDTQSFGAADELYAQSSYVYGLNSADGSVLWKFTHPHEFYTDVVAA